MHRVTQYVFKGLGRRAAWTALAIFVALQAALPSLFATPRLLLFDLYQQSAPRLERSNAVVIVDIDDDSLATLGQWPWPRQVTARLVSKVLADRPLALGIDMIMPEPDRQSPEEWLRHEGDMPQALSDGIRARPSHDALLARAIEAGPVTIGIGGLRLLEGRSDSGPLAPFRPVEPIGLTQLPSSVSRFNATLRSIPVLDNAAAGHSLLSVDPDSDGVVRRVPLVSQLSGRLAPSLALEVLRLAAEASWYDLYARAGVVQGVGVGPLKIPTQSDGSVWVHYSPHDSRRFVSAADVLSGKIAAGSFEQKIVLIGVTGTGLTDLGLTPLGQMPGTEITAQLLENILDGRMVQRPNWTRWVEPALTLALGTLLILILPLMRPHWHALIGLVSLSALAVAGAVFWQQGLLLVDVATPAIGAALTFVVLLTAGFAEAEAGRRKIRSAFAHYLSPDIVESIANDPSQVKLGGDTRELTVMFCDIRGFTPIAESFRSDPQGLTRLISRALTSLSREVLNHRGTIDKYIGDCVMAFWNAPLDDAQHAARACDCALGMMDALAVLNRELAADTAASRANPIEVSIGLNTGVCVVGNMGSEFRFDYSALGDAVNVSARIQSSASNYGFPIIIGEDTRNAVADKFAFIEIDYVAVKGRATPTRIFALMGRADTRETEAFKRLNDALQTLFAAFRTQNWAAARDAIAAGRQIDVAPAAIFDTYEGRIAYYTLAPPPAGWDGAWSAKEK